MLNIAERANEIVKNDKFLLELSVKTWLSQESWRWEVGHSCSAMSYNLRWDNEDSEKRQHFEVIWLLGESEAVVGVDCGAKYFYLGEHIVKKSVEKQCLIMQNRKQINEWTWRTPEKPKRIKPRTKIYILIWGKVKKIVVYTNKIQNYFR